MAILAGLKSSSVGRLKHTIDAVGERNMSKIATIEKECNPTMSYKMYREAIHLANPPLLPYLGVYLTDLTFIEDGNPDYVNGLHNFKKRELIYNVIAEIGRYQTLGYNSSTVPNVLHYLSELPSNDDDTLYELSLLREPRGADKSEIV